MSLAAGDTLPVEYFDEILRLASEGGQSGYVDVLLDYPGRLDAGRLSRAMRLLIDAIPVLGCRFDAEGERPVWRRRADLDALAACPIVQGKTLEDGTRLRIGRRPAIDEADNIVLALVRPSDSAGDRLVIRFSHVPSDATGWFTALETLVGTYTALADDDTYVATALTASRDGLAWRHGFGWRDRWRMTRDDFRAVRRAMRPVGGLAMGDVAAFDAERESLEPGHRILRLAPERTRALRVRARALGGDLTEAMTAAFLRAFDEFCPHPASAPLGVMLPVDLRRYCPVEQSAAYANLTGGCFVRVPRTGGENFEATLRHVLDNMAEARNGFIGTEGHLAHLLMSRMSFRRKRRLFAGQRARMENTTLAPGLSIARRVASRRLALDGAAPLAMAVVPEASPLAIYPTVVARLDDAVSFSVSFDRRFGEGRIEAFLARLDHHLSA